MSAVADTDRTQQIASYLHRLHEDTHGWLFVGHGSDPYLHGDNKVKHRQFRETPYMWPGQADQIVDHIHSLSATCDVWTTPGLSENPIRQMQRRKPLPARHLWVDLDGAQTEHLERARQLTTAGSFTVASGRGAGHLHIYIALDDPTNPDTIADLNRRLVAWLHGDASPSALNGYLRPPGTYNWKPTILHPGTQPTLVHVAEDTVGAGWAPTDLDDTLPVAPRLTIVGVDLEAADIPGDLPADIASILADPPDMADTDRSARLFALVVACRRHGYSDGQTLTIGRAWKPGLAKYGRRLDEQIGRCLAKTQPRPGARGNGGGNGGGGGLPGPPGGAADQGVHYEATDLGNARRLVDHSGHLYHHVPEWGRWLTWDDRRWATDTLGTIQLAAKASAEAILDEARANSDQTLFRWGLRSQSSASISNAVHLAATEPAIPVYVNQLDADPWALNVSNGTLNLRTGDLHPSDPAQLLTKLTEVVWDPDATCPTWHATLERALPDPDIRDWVQRLAGYALTGLTVEQILVFFLGTGANGKSTITNTLMALMGEYAAPAPPKLLVVEKHESHPTQIADLFGRRLVIAQEIQAGQRLDEEMVKQLTGGDRLKARYMRQDFFDFQATHKLILCANHKPKIAGTDHAIWRRLRLVPFDITIPEDERDRHLGDRLHHELPGILRWAVAGCLAWQNHGLKPPAAVADATSAYQLEMDTVSQFIADRCLLNPNVQVRSSELYEAYKTWSAANGHTHPLSQKSLAGRLEERALHRVEDRMKRAWWVGIAIRADEEENPS